MQLSSYLDSTLLKPESTALEITELCHEAVEQGIYAVCVAPYRLMQAGSALASSPVRLCTVIAFPLGAEPPDSKCDSARRCLDSGADELDVVMNIGAMKDADHAHLEREIRAISDLKEYKPFIFKYIVETALLNEEELRWITSCLIRHGVDYIKTSTGFSSRGASLNDIATIKDAKGGQRLKIKASGGIRELDWALQLIEAGVDRIGSSSAVALLKEMERRQGHGR